ncbi:DUF1513 domain-containing protein [Roseixanthobacter glucoisosaccharinicivorans]|uniref:DUF1513 domain-containing protein n=1 Tax=Roseixanthobacter glucoisosaccharinicivorans TaxID=3119923 RepID=UPI003726B0F6
MISRRTLLLGAGALAAASRLDLARAHELSHAQDTLTKGWLATGQVAGGFAPLALDGAFEADPLALSPTRLHAIEPAAHGPLAVAVGRRPGKVALVLDRAAGTEVARFAPGGDRVFSGHGRFTPDGTGFLTVEIDPANDEGTLALRRIAGHFEIVAEWPTRGPGPHDMLHMGDGLIIANGGVEPGTPAAVGCEETGANLALLGPDGSTRAVFAPGGDLASLSLRHLARDAAGAVVAAQEISLVPSSKPLLFAIDEARGLTAYEAPDEAWMGLRGYIGSVALDASGRIAAAASPRGGRVAFWERTGRYLGFVPFADGCGLAPTAEAGRFLATSGYGEVVLIAVEDRSPRILARHTGGPRFDNHVSRVA